MEIAPTFSIPENELTFTFVRASGPGGQNVNKVATAVQLRFNARNSPSLTAEVKQRLIKLAGTRVTQDGVLVIEAKRYRSQEKNRTDAQNRLKALILNAALPPKVRHVTSPTLTARVERVESKKKRGAIKKLRQSTEE